MVVSQVSPLSFLDDIFLSFNKASSTCSCLPSFHQFTFFILLLSFLHVFVLTTFSSHRWLPFHIFQRCCLSLPTTESLQFCCTFLMLHNDIMHFKCCLFPCQKFFLFFLNTFFYIFYFFKCTISGTEYRN